MKSEEKFTLSEKWPIIVALAALIIGLVGIITISMVYGLSGGKYPNDYGVVMDAGSSKTNTIVYSWKSNKHKGTGCVSQENNCKADGGIADKNPTEIDEVIECAENVTKIVPEKSRSKTPLFFAATAGMRLLNLTNPTRAKEILEQLKSELNRTGLSVKKVEMISGRDEGLYAWISANFLQQTLETQQPNPWKPTTFGALDMGGASLQIAYALPEKVEDPSIVSLKLYGQEHNVQSESSLCFGRTEAERRYRFLLAYKDPKKIRREDPCLPTGYTYEMKGGELFGRPCTQSVAFDEVLNKDREGILSTTYYFVGTSSPAYCAGNVSKLLDNYLCKRELRFKECFKARDDIPTDQEYLAFATYFFTTDFFNVTQSTLEEYVNATYDYCAKSSAEVNATSTSKFRNQQCFNGNYIHTVLTNGFKFESKTWKHIHFVDKIAGKDVGWTLGYMIKATNRIPQKSPLPRLISTVALTLCLLLFILVIIGTIIFVYYHQNGKSTSGKITF